MIAESFRLASTSLLFAPNSLTHPQVLAFTSALPGEGKTTIASNISIIMARGGQRVLLIDADMRKPSVHRAFGVPRECGLADLLQPDKASRIDCGPRETTIPNLSVLPAGLCESSEAWNLTKSDQMFEVIAEFRKDYDVIVIDTPPVLLMPDARAIARVANSVVLIVRAGSTPSEAAGTAAQWLAENGTPLAGAILNCWTPGGRSAAYRYAYKGYYSD